MTNKTGQRHYRQIIERHLFLLCFAFDLMRSYFLKWKEIKKAKKLDLPVFEKTVFTARKKKENFVFFIFGGGPSINELATEDYNFIKRQNSLGLNWWFIQKFEPSFLLFEGFPENENEQSEIYQWTKKYFMKFAAETTSIVLLKDIYRSKLFWSDLANLNNKNIFVVPGFLIGGFQKVAETIKLLFFLKIATNEFLVRRGSLTMAISIGLNLGFKEIVLLGFDGGNGYFFDSHSYQGRFGEQIPPWRLRDRPRIHRTTDKTLDSITIDLIIKILQKYMLEPSKVKLFVGSKKSFLYPLLPLYKFPHANSKNEL